MRIRGYDVSASQDQDILTLRLQKKTGNNTFEKKSPEELQTS
jgi:hypothetical protein